MILRMIIHYTLFLTNTRIQAVHNAMNEDTDIDNGDGESVVASVLNLNTATVE